MIDWDALIEQPKSMENTGNNPKSRALPDHFPTNSESRTDSKPNTDNDFRDCARLARPARPKNDGVGDNQENNPSVEGGASENFRDAKTYSVNPIAICLLLTCCNKTTASKDETLEAIMKLQTIPQQEQVRSWTMLCHSYDIDPYRIIYPFIQSPIKGKSCQDCKHLEMQSIHKEGTRRVFSFVCSQHHHILEAYYICERVIIAPESCNDYQSTALPGKN